MTIRPGSKVRWRATGKGARAEGRAGKVCTGIVVEVAGGWARIRPDFKTMFGFCQVPLTYLTLTS